MKLRLLIGLMFSFSVAACSGENKSEIVRNEQPTAASATSVRHAQETVDMLASTLDVNYQVMQNRSSAPCVLTGGERYDGGPCYEGKITLRARGDIPGNKWTIYFSQVEPVFSSSSAELEMERVNGDLHRITPKADFSPFQTGDEKTVFFIARGQVLTEAKLLPNYYAAADGAEPEIIESTKIAVNPETGLAARPYISPLHDVEKHFRSGPNDATPLATAEFLFSANQTTEKASPDIIDRAIIPTPKLIAPTPAAKRFDFSEGVALKLEGVERDEIEAPLNRLTVFGMKETPDGAPIAISVAPDSSKPSGAYRLTVTADAIDISGVDAPGAAYGLYSLASLITLGRSDIPTLLVEDAPRYQFRGMHVDAARNFHSKETILKLLDQMAAYKLNKLHLHLADDEGWRLEIPGLPELTEIGSKRCHDLQENECLMPFLGSGPNTEAPVNGFYSILDYEEILKAASKRHIQVIPSLDMPGHARAAVKSMEARRRKLSAEGRGAEAKEFLLTDPDDETIYESVQFYNDNTINPCMESTYTFIAKVIDEVKTMHARAGHPLTRYHIGADETAGAWNDSPICKAFLSNNNYSVTSVDQLGAYFIERVAALLNERDIETAGWSDGIGHTDKDKMPAVVQSNVWTPIASSGSAVAHQQMNQGFEVVLSPPDVLYFDFPYEADPKEGGYYWGARRINTRKVFEFMPDNLPVHAEFWKDTREQPFEVHDTTQTVDNGAMVHGPLKRGNSIAGIQGQIWSETVTTQPALEYQVFPRLIALAERAWREAEWEVPYDYSGAIYDHDTNTFNKERRASRDRSWGRFASILGAKELEKLDHANIAYRIPTVGAKVENGILHANVIFPGLEIEFREEGGQWRAYQENVSVSAPVEIRAISANGMRRGRSLIVEP